MMGKSSGLNGLVYGFEPPEYYQMTTECINNRRVAPSFAEAPQEAERSGVHVDSADALDKHYATEANDVKMSLYRNTLGIEEAQSFEPVDRDFSAMMRQLGQAQTFRSIGQERQAEKLEREAERKCPGIMTKFRVVGWPGVEAESLTALQHRLSGDPRYPLLGLL